jgi:hypothetical protein
MVLGYGIVSSLMNFGVGVWCLRKLLREGVLLLVLCFFFPSVFCFLFSSPVGVWCVVWGSVLLFLALPVLVLVFLFVIIQVLLVLII